MPDANHVCWLIQRLQPDSCITSPPIWSCASWADAFHTEKIEENNGECQVLSTRICDAARRNFATSPSPSARPSALLAVSLHATVANDLPTTANHRNSSISGELDQHRECPCTTVNICCTSLSTVRCLASFFELHRRKTTTPSRHLNFLCLACPFCSCLIGLFHFIINAIWHTFPAQRCSPPRRPGPGPDILCLFTLCGLMIFCYVQSVQD